MDRKQSASPAVTRDLKTRQVSIVPGSEGLFYPIWSPNAANIAADAWGGQRNGTWIYNVSTHEWNRLPLVDYGYWAQSHDSKVANLTGIRRVEGAFSEWLGLGPGHTPLLLRNTGNQQIYALDWEAP